MRERLEARLELTMDAVRAVQERDDVTTDTVNALIERAGAR